jgi:hypothetical protein
MKIKLDENIPARLANILSQFGHEIDTVPQEGLIGYIMITGFGRLHKIPSLFSSHRI